MVEARNYTFADMIFFAIL